MFLQTVKIQSCYLYLSGQVSVVYKHHVNLKLDGGELIPEKFILHTYFNIHLSYK